MFLFLSQHRLRVMFVITNKTVTGKGRSWEEEISGRDRGLHLMKSNEKAPRK